MKGMKKRKMKKGNMTTSMNEMTKPMQRDSYYHLSSKKRTRRSGM